MKLKTWLRSLNTLHFKLVLLFSVLTIVTTMLTLGLVNFYVRQGRPANELIPARVRMVVPGAAGSFVVADEIAAQIQSEREALQQTIALLSAVIVVTQITIGTIATSVIVRHSLQPLSQLNQRMKQINSLDLRSKIIKNRSESEVSELIDNFNSMIEKIQDYVDKEKEFTQNISHELKTPLSAVKANLESVLILEAAQGESADSIVRAVKSVDSLNNLINDLSLLSNIERKNFKVETFEVGKLLQGVAREVEHTWQARKPKLRVQLPAQKIKMRGQPMLFNRAIANLIENSIKYSNNSPEIKITAATVAGNVQITIQDNGIGIPSSKLKRIYDRFYRVEQSRNRSTGGSGLGLAIVREIVDLFKGNIAVSSVENQGTTFVLTFPLREK
jgi:signal transduction histidine kinase